MINIPLYLPGMAYTFHFQPTPPVVMPAHNILSHPLWPPMAALQSSIPPLGSPPHPPIHISHNLLSPLHLASLTSLTSPASSNMSNDLGSYMGGRVPLDLQSLTSITLDPSLLALMSPPGISNVCNGGSFPSSTFPHHHHHNSIFPSSNSMDTRSFKTLPTLSLKLTCPN